MLIGDRLRVVAISPPSGDSACEIASPKLGIGDARPGGIIDIVLTTGAFGSGEHETTADCLELLTEMAEVKGADVLDLGSGTGVLAIAALKLGARRALCVDIEAGAVATARRNCILNRVAEQTRHVLGELNAIRSPGFDLVLANIYADVLLTRLGDLVTLTRPGGRLLLSGIPWECNWDVRQGYQRRGCVVLDNRMLANFSTVLLAAGDSEAI